MATSSKANIAKFLAVATVAGISTMVGSPELPGILGATALAALPISKDLLQNVQEILKEPARQWAGGFAQDTVTKIAEVFEDTTPGLNEQLRVIVAQATQIAVKDVWNSFHDVPYYQRATDKAAMDEIFRTLYAVTKERQFLRIAIADLRENGEMYVLVRNQSKRVSDILKEEIVKHLADHDEGVVNFLQLCLPSCIVTRFVELLSKNSEEGIQARNAFTILHLTSILEGIKTLRTQLDTLLFGQSVTNKRLEEFELKFTELLKPTNTSLDSSLVFKYVQEYLQQISRRELLHEVTVYISTASEELLGFREEVRKYFSRFSSYYVADSNTPLTDKERQEYIAACDLFVGIYPESSHPVFQGVDELGIAYSHFRRCLVYVPTPKQAIPDSENDREVRVIPTYQFLSATDLVTNLERRLQELEQGELTGFPRDVIAKRWEQWLINQRQELWQNDLYNSSAQLASPLEKQYTKLFGTRWHIDALRLAQAVVQAAKKLLAASTELQTNAKQNLQKYTTLPVDCQIENYDQIQKRLADWCAPRKMEQLIRDIKKLISKQKPGKNNVKPVQRLLYSWLDTIKQLNKFLATPKYTNCLLVLGQLGSGKSHFIARLLEQHNQEDATEKLFCLYIPLELARREGAGQATIDELVLKSAALQMHDKPSGPAWRSLQEVASFVQTEQGKLLIILDDLDQWIQSQTLKLNELQEYIERHTNIHNLYWVICASEANYEFAVTSPYATTNFWHHYGYVENIDPTSSTGWIRLDRLNDQENVWREILKTELGVEELPDSVLSTLDDVSSDLLSLPFVTRIIADLIRTGEMPLSELPNLHYIGFVVGFWQKRLDKALRRSEIDPVSLERTIYLISATCLHEGSSLIAKPMLLRRVLELDEKRTDNFDEASVRAAIRNLASIELLSEETADVARYGHRIELDVLPIWLWKSGIYLMDRLADDIHAGEDVRDWLTKYIVGDQANSYLQGVIEFLIMLVDVGDRSITAVEARLNQDMAQLLTQNIVLALPAYQSRVWLAASKASATFQHNIATWLEKRIGQVRIDANSVYQYLYFLKYAAAPESHDSGVPLPVRVKLAQPYYTVIGPLYTDYFLDAVEDLAATVQRGEELIDAYVHFYGIEPILPSSAKWPTTGAMAAWSYSLLCALLPENEPVSDVTELRQWIIQFLKDTARMRVNRKVEKYDYYWVSLLRCYCDSLAVDLTQERMSTLQKEGWFSTTGELAQLADMREMMEDQLTSASGKYFREKAKPLQKSNYNLLVKSWAESPGDTDRQRVAFFLIYHSVPAKGPYQKRMVSEELWIILQTLRIEPHIQVLLKQEVFALWYKRQEEQRNELEQTGAK